jgi:Domain of unknown function (DUF4331)
MSDHFSGPRAIAGPAGDITDLYAFPSPERPGQLVLVLDVLPHASRDSHFSDAIVYRLRLRPVTIAGTGAATAFAFAGEDKELVFSCHFEAPRQGGAGAAPVQEGWCVAPSGETTRFRVNDEQGTSSDGLRVYAGLRAEPFFIDVQALAESQKTGRLAFKEVGTNAAIGFNVLSIVVEVDCRPWLRSGYGPLLAVVGETVVAGKLPIRIERFGRPEIKNVILQMKQFDQVNRDLEVRDLYNLEDAFHMSKDYGGVYRARMNANLAMNDRLDGKIDWQLGPDGAHPLTELLLADYMVVDVTKPYAADSFFEIEQAALDGRTHQTCGGRSLNDDVIDKLLTLIVNGGKGPRVSDGVDRPATPVSDTFPYQAPPTSVPVPQATLQGLDLVTGQAGKQGL